MDEVPHYGTIRVTRDGEGTYRMRFLLHDGSDRPGSHGLELYDSLTAFQVAEKLRPYLGNPLVEVFGDVSGEIGRYLDRLAPTQD
jgi:hypothetical protein